MKSMRWAVIVALLLGLAYSPAQAVWAADPPCAVGFEGDGACSTPISVQGSTFKYQYVDDEHAFYAIPVNGQVSGGNPNDSVPQEYTFQPNCAGNHAPGEGAGDNAALCIGAVSVCGDNRLQLQVWSRDAGTQTAWKLVGLECIGGPPTITLPDLIVDLVPVINIDVANTDVTKAAITISPPTLALVNLPVIAATTLAPATLHIDDPFAADVQITPVPTWNFGDGSPTVTGPVGAKYDGTSALDNPGHYPLTHTYAKPGDYTVTLSVVWTAVSITTAEHPAPIALPDPQPNATTTTTLAVTAHEAHAVLVSGG